MNLVKNSPDQRYGKALFDLSVDEKASILKDVDALLDAVESSQDLQDVLAHPTLPIEQKEKVLHTLIGGKKGSVLQRFSSLVAARRRTNSLAGMLAWFKHYERASKGGIVAEVRSATKLSKKQKDDVLAFVQQHQPKAKTIELQEEVDASLIAGVKVKIGSEQFDSTVRGRLDGLRIALKS